MDVETILGLVDPKWHDCMDNIHEMCNAPYAVNNGIELVSIDKDGTVVMKKDVLPHDLNSNGVVHGAATFGIIDHTFAVIGNMDVRTVGLSCNVTYYRPCFGSMITAEAKMITNQKR
ncbi:MAG: PaaI family thioesterase [Methanomassiliicoccaceae archaeon]|nr:PaaI family thioesterase [Methanomassiliicoccaceae archaeon]